MISLGLGIFSTQCEKIRSLISSVLRLPIKIVRLKSAKTLHCDECIPRNLFNFLSFKRSRVQQYTLRNILFCADPTLVCDLFPARRRS